MRPLTCPWPGEVAGTVSRPALHLEREGDGTYLLGNTAGVVVGVGGSLAEADADFRLSLRQRVIYLRENFGRLDSRLQASLRRLESEFPWV